ncbi:ribosomal protein L30p/L7e-domain-containing protein [Xylaria digitata]|nr:ribosomal protein L30p/L7e-domain-containing protein [Xylaria digitata]
MSYFRITLHRSAIGLPQRTRGVLAALGLRKRSQTVFHPVTPDSAGMIMKVKELVLVQEVDKALTSKELREERKPVPGFWIEKAVPSGVRGEIATPGFLAVVRRAYGMNRHVD